MNLLLKRARDEVLLPLVRRPRLLQIAALCTRGPGVREVLLVTSRGTKRWIVPKGWPHRGADGPASALAEAWEEAGVKEATAEPRPVGRYAAVKRSATGLAEPCDVVGGRSTSPRRWSRASRGAPRRRPA